MEVTVLIFASLKDRLGQGAVKICVPDHATAISVFEHLNLQPDEKAVWRQACRVAVNARYVSPETALCHGDEVAIVPPVAGG